MNLVLVVLFFSDEIGNLVLIVVIEYCGCPVEVSDKCVPAQPENTIVGLNKIHLFLPLWMLIPDWIIVLPRSIIVLMIPRVSNFDDTVLY